MQPIRQLGCSKFEVEGFNTTPGAAAEAERRTNDARTDLA